MNNRFEMKSKNTDNFGSNVVPTRWNRKFGERLAVRRKKFGWYQPDLARKTGISIRAIQNYEKGKIPIGRYLNLLADKLGCTVGWLLNDEGSEPDLPVGDEVPKTTPIYNKVEELADRAHHVADVDQEFDKHGGWKVRPEMKTDINRMLGFTYQILSSESIYSNALAANINAFYAALTVEKDLKNTKNTLKIQSDEIESLKKRVVALEKKKDGDDMLRKY